MKQTRRKVDPQLDLGPGFLTIEKPARYLGGELGSISRHCRDEDFLFALSFPDLYEIGMSNNAIRILYSELNARPGVRCERVFAPAPDLEALLANCDQPLFTLESHTAIGDADILGISLGYELAATSVLAILSSGQIPLHVTDRSGSDPIVVMGGPAISNPHPFSRFIEAAYIGEAEATFFDLMEALAKLRKAGASRLDMLAHLATDKAVWLSPDAHRFLADSGKTPVLHKTVRAVYADFSRHLYSTAFPVATMKTVQDHGTVEVMRGCPNGCRFCHAGYYYRPQRLKPFSLIREEVRGLVLKGGYHQITLASLSSGDYPQIEKVLDALNAEWGGKGVSFQLPSLKISSFTLPLLEKLSEVRKSGLTFAVETPNDAWQRVINKDVSFEQTIAILDEAKTKGFRLAKFYFMIGLPLPGGVIAEVDSIIGFFERLLARVSIQLNVNVGTFVPKAFTPFQWVPALGEEEALQAIFRLKDGLKKFRGLKVSYHSPFVSMLEGIISRGDERVGGLIEEAFRQGARLDAWDEHFQRELWRSVLKGAPWNVFTESARARDLDEGLPWDDITIRVSKSYLQAEYRAAIAGSATSACDENCNNSCASCDDSLAVVRKSEHIEVHNTDPLDKKCEGLPCRLVYSFEKNAIARLYPHLSIIEAFARAFQMIGLPIAFSEGFNPMPRMELSQPLPLGVSAGAEYASLILKNSPFGDGGWSDGASLAKAVNDCLPEGLRMSPPEEFPLPVGKKIYSLASLSWGSEYALTIPSQRSSVQGIDELFIALSGRMDALEIPGASLSMNDAKKIRVCLPDPVRKELGLMRILESIVLLRPIPAVLDVRRVRCLAKGRHEQGWQEYMDAFRDLAQNQ